MRTLAAIFVTLALAPAGLAADLQRDARLEQSLVHQINAVRHDHGLRPLVISARLGASAAQHTREMGIEGYFEHESYNHSPFWKRIERWYPSSGWSNWAVGENILWSSPDLSPSYAVNSWMSSPGHRANLLSRTWREIGVSALHFESAPGEYEGNPVTIVTADFGARR